MPALLQIRKSSRCMVISFFVVLAIMGPGLFSLRVFEDSITAHADSSKTLYERTPQSLPVGAKTFIKGELIELEVALTSQQFAIGLMFRDVIPDNRGMLFIFQQPSTARFWMKNVLVELDMIFLRNGVIKHIDHSVPPCKGVACPSYGPEFRVDWVLELRGGKAEELGLKVGDLILVDFLE